MTLEPILSHNGGAPYILKIHFSCDALQQNIADMRLRDRGLRSLAINASFPSFRCKEFELDLPTVDPLVALGVVAATALTDACYVMFTAAVAARRRLPAASWSSVWYLLSSFAVISYTSNWIYVCFAAIGSWIGAFASISLMHRPSPKL